MEQQIGQTIKRHREANHLTQKALAAVLHISPQAISKWENNTSLPDISLVVPLAHVLHISTDTLLGAFEDHEQRRER